jgi:hypothetical protein
MTGALERFPRIPELVLGIDERRAQQVGEQRIRLGTVADIVRRGGSLTSIGEELEEGLRPIAVPPPQDRDTFAKVPSPAGRGCPKGG